MSIFKCLNSQKKKPISSLIKPFINSVLKNEFMQWGYYKSYNKNPNKEIIFSTIKHHYVNEKMNDELFQEKYLEKIVCLCRHKKIRLIFLSTPVHQVYRNNVKQKYFRILANNITSYPDIEYQNYLGVKTNPFFLADANHLNVEGGEVFTLQIIKNLKTRTHDVVYEK